jgi:hypothetical protein
VYVRLTRDEVRNAPEYEPEATSTDMGLERGMGAAPLP